MWKDARTAGLVAVAGLRADYHNVHFRGQAHPQPWKATDFLPGKKPQTIEEKIAAMVAWKEVAGELKNQTGINPLAEREAEVKSIDPAAADRWAQLKAQAGKR